MKISIVLEGVIITKILSPCLSSFSPFPHPPPLPHPGLSIKEKWMKNLKGINKKGNNESTKKNKNS
jgi:hypothetical protein